MSTIVVDPDHALEKAQRDFLKKVCLFFFFIFLGQDHFSNSLSQTLMPNPVLRPSVSHMKRHVMFKNM